MKEFKAFISWVLLLYLLIAAARGGASAELAGIEYDASVVEEACVI